MNGTMNSGWPSNSFSTTPVSRRGWTLLVIVDVTLVICHVRVSMDVSKGLYLKSPGDSLFVCRIQLCFHVYVIFSASSTAVVPSVLASGTLVTNISQFFRSGLHLTSEESSPGSRHSHIMDLCECLSEPGCLLLTLHRPFHSSPGLDDESLHQHILI